LDQGVGLDFETQIWLGRRIFRPILLKSYI
jgi:hypothetical protein